MNKPALTEVQQQAVRVALATLRHSSRDAFLQALAGELARHRYPPSDTDVKVAIRQLLGIIPLRNFVAGDAVQHSDAAACQCEKLGQVPNLGSCDQRRKTRQVAKLATCDQKGESDAQTQLFQSRWC
jgi:hypothetical protein